MANQSDLMATQWMTLPMRGVIEYFRMCISAIFLGECLHNPTRIYVNLSKFTTHEVSEIQVGLIISCKIMTADRGLPNKQKIQH